MKKYILSVLLVILFAPTQAQEQPQQVTTPTTWQLAKHDAKLMFGGLKYTYSRPFSWGQDDWAIAAGVVVGAAGLNIIDQQTSDFFVKHEPDVPNILKDFGWYFGSPQNNYGITGSVYLFGLFTKNEKIRRTGILMISAASAAGLIQTVSKTVTGRARPSDGGKFSFKPFSNEGKYHSFPSGHTILSFTTFYALSKQFSNPWVKAGLITAGMISPVSRLLAGAHWLTDVALSLALTVAVVESVDKYLDKEMGSLSEMEARKAKKKISWNLKLGAGSFGITGTF
ncbi:MAG: phosphatase PAP2 family protein [Mesonia hippocampi]|uniref:phosphatase PAP2 family protein n=1 Tax=Mesonia hippocampi TaxID=1628250 RepID=UPI003F9E039E